MKKLLFFLLNILVILSLCACSSSPTAYTVEKDGTSYEVNTENSTISDGTHTYRYSFSGNSSDYNVKITYPDSSSYWFQMSGSTGYGGWSENYDEKRYVDGDTLRDVILEKAPRESTPGKFLAALILIGVGILNIASPHTAWYLEYGWRYKNAEPSDLALSLGRLSGFVAIIIAVVLMF